MQALSVAKHDVGHGELDAEHRAIFDLQDEAIAAFRAGDRLRGAIALHAVEEALGDHFAVEERLMRDSGYPERAVHDEAHRLFVADLGRLASVVSDGTSAAAAAVWLDSRSGSWWRMHIRTNDAALARHLAAAPPPPAEPGDLANEAPPR
jgi:hemerythrin-like metal-binding protein